jgi:hypothetical protein
MDIQHGHEHYWTELFENAQDGCIGYRLHRERFGKLAVAAVVVYWDATGGFTVQTLDGDVPVEVIHAAIAESQQKIRTQ